MIASAVGKTTSVASSEKTAKTRSVASSEKTALKKDQEILELLDSGLGSNEKPTHFLGRAGRRIGNVGKTVRKTAAGAAGSVAQAGKRGLRNPLQQLEHAIMLSGGTVLGAGGTLLSSGLGVLGAVGNAGYGMVVSGKSSGGVNQEIVTGYEEKKVVREAAAARPARSARTEDRELLSLYACERRNEGRC